MRSFSRLQALILVAAVAFSGGIVFAGPANVPFDEEGPFVKGPAVVGQFIAIPFGAVGGAGVGVLTAPFAMAVGEDPFVWTGNCIACGTGEFAYCFGVVTGSPFLAVQKVLVEFPCSLFKPN